jgi:hypothetical protein
LEDVEDHDIERLHEELRRRVKTQGSLPTEDAALVLLFGLVVSGQIRLYFDPAGAARFLAQARLQTPVSNRQTNAA